jgi:hypothetical protein
MKKFLPVIFAIISLFCVCLTGCGQTPPSSPQGELTKSDYIEVFDKVTADCSSFLTSSVSPALTGQGVSANELVDANNDGQAKNQLRASTAMVYFMKNICERQDYSIKDGYDDCIVSQGSETFNLRFSLSYDKDNSVINIPIIAEEEGHISAYFNFFITYDFTAQKVDDFVILGVSGSRVGYYKFANSTLKTLPNTAPSYEGLEQQVLTIYEEDFTDGEILDSTVFVGQIQDGYEYYIEIEYRRIIFAG